MKALQKLAFPTAAVMVCVYILFLPPFHGIADNGDFARVLYPSGLKIPDGHSYFATIDLYYKNGFSYIGHMLTYPLALLGLYPAPPHIYPTAAARILTGAFGFFDIRVYAAAVCAWYISVWTALINRIADFKQRLIMSAAVIFVFFDGSYIQMFASFYGEGMILVTLVTMLLCYVRFRENPTAVNMVLFAFSSNLLINSKLQCTVWLPFAAAVIYYIGRNSVDFHKRGYKIASVAACVVLAWNAVGGYFINGAPIKEGASYNALMCGILTVSDNPEEDIQELGLPPECIDDIGKNAYQAAEDYAVNPSDIDITMGKIAGFYIRHPRLLMRGLRITAGSMLDTNIHMGTLEREYAEDYRFNLWGELRSRLGGYPIWAVIIAAAALCVCAGRKRASILPMLICFAAVEFMLPFAGNGACDIQKQLIPVNMVWDMSVLFLTRELLGLVCRDKSVNQLIE